MANTLTSKLYPLIPVFVFFHPLWPSFHFMVTYHRLYSQSHVTWSLGHVRRNTSYEIIHNWKYFSNLSHFQNDLKILYIYNKWKEIFITEPIVGFFLICWDGDCYSKFVESYEVGNMKSSSQENCYVCVEEDTRRNWLIRTLWLEFKCPKTNQIIRVILSPLSYLLPFLVSILIFL